MRQPIEANQGETYVGESFFDRSVCFFQRAVRSSHHKFAVDLPQKWILFSPLRLTHQWSFEFCQCFLPALSTYPR